MCDVSKRSKIQPYLVHIFLLPLWIPQELQNFQNHSRAWLPFIKAIYNWPTGWAAVNHKSPNVRGGSIQHFSYQLCLSRLWYMYWLKRRRESWSSSQQPLGQVSAVPTYSMTDTEEGIVRSQAGWSAVMTAVSGVLYAEQPVRILIHWSFKILV